MIRVVSRRSRLEIIKYHFYKRLMRVTQYSVISWHRRAGKDVTSFNALMKRAIHDGWQLLLPIPDQSVGATCIVGQHL
jgi:hypothetical protein